MRRHGRGLRSRHPARYTGRARDGGCEVVSGCGCWHRRAIRRGIAGCRRLGSGNGPTPRGGDPVTRVVVLAAHPDDELLGAGATLAKHVQASDEVHAVILADGATSRYDVGMVDVLATASKRAAATLGLTSIRSCGLPDQRLDQLALVEITQAVETILDELRPQVVYSHFPGDVNLDHGVVARAAWTACRPYVLPDLRRFAVFETPSSTEWAWPTIGEAFRPGLFSDVTATLDIK